MSHYHIKTVPRNFVFQLRSLCWSISPLPSCRIQDDGLQLTRAWLKRHAPPDEELASADAAAPSDSARFLRLRVQRVLNDAFLELLEWDDDQGCARFKLFLLLEGFTNLV